MLGVNINMYLVIGYHSLRSHFSPSTVNIYDSILNSHIFTKN